MSSKTNLELLIREIEPVTKNDRYMRENLRRIKQFLDDVYGGKAELITYSSLGPPSVFDGVYRSPVTINGQTSFTLADIPAAPSLSRMLINGVEIKYGSHYSITSNIVTFDPVTAGYTLETVNEFGVPDEVAIYYIKGT